MMNILYYKLWYNSTCTLLELFQSGLMLAYILYVLTLPFFPTIHSFNESRVLAKIPYASIHSTHKSLMDQSTLAPSHSWNAIFHSLWTPSHSWIILRTFLLILSELEVTFKVLFKCYYSFQICFLLIFKQSIYAIIHTAFASSHSWNILDMIFCILIKLSYSRIIIHWLWVILKVLICATA